ncbi:uncharacterized protein LOC143836752 [Paroedura picta]|uniref:uncharacterized protein LOC143836752 n=1 Tax=Paroedura picta TaxID=143630 RepID=UPI004057981C
MINILRHIKREIGMMKWWKRLIILLCLSDIRNKASFGISSILGDGNGSERKARIGSIISGGVDGVSNVVSGGVDGVSNVISGGVDGVSNVVSGGVDGVSNVISGGVDGVSNVVSGGVDGVGDVVSGGINGVGDVVSGGINGVGDVVSGGINGVLGLFGGSENQGAAGTTAPPQPDTGYLVLKVDLLSSDSANISALIQPVMTEVKQLLEMGLPSGTFKLTWVAYEQ